MDRKEAIEIVQKNYPHVGFSGSEFETASRELVPELKESKDERIRKELLSFIESVQHSYLCATDRREKWLAYLERQKEQKPAEGTALQKAFISSKIDYTLEEKCDASDYADAILPTSVTYGENEEEYKLHKIIEAAFIAGQKKERQPAEYEKPLLSKFEQAVYDCAWGKVTCKPEGETREEYAKRWAEHLLLMVRDWADDYIDSQIDLAERKAYEKGKADAGKPAEWSEEDEKIINGICGNLEYLLHNTICAEQTKVNLENRIKWLIRIKDLRPSWKPSEEQMRALNYFIKLWGNSDDQLEYTKIFNTVKSLRDELKILM